MAQQEQILAELPKDKVKYGAFDIIFLVIIIAVYSYVAFSNLGDKFAAQTVAYADPNQTITVKIENPEQIKSFWYFANAENDQIFTVSFSNDGVNYTNDTTVEGVDVFDWGHKDVDVNAEYIKIVPEKNLLMNEMAFKDEENNVIPVVSVEGTSTSEKLFDEQQYVPERNDYMNSTYFDEIYHPRTAYEYLHGLRVYEWTHPPFGKWLISLGISAYGMTPFGWRFVGVLFGVFMIPAIYFFAKFLFKKNVLSAAVCTMFTFDFMHYAQSRLATVDTYITFFVILMYMFMFKYITTNYNDKNQEKDFRKNLIWLALSGISMGLGVASKWPGVYAGIGLAVIFFTFVGVRFLEFIGIKNKAPKKMSADERFIKDNFKQMTLKTFAACVVFFVIIPIGIYLASYALVFESYAKYYDGYDYNFIEIVLKNQEAMYNYHSSLESSHPYSAAWWQWPFNMRPMFYYSAETLDKLKQGISSFGNPIVWFCGFFAALYCAFKAVKKKSSTAAFIFVGYIAQYLPWILVSRTTYAYHYFPCVPFLVLALGEAFKDIASIIRHSTSNKAVFGKNFGGFVIPYTPVVVFSIVAVILFFVFLPVLTGTPIPYEYAEKLRWMKGWQLVI